MEDLHSSSSHNIPFVFKFKIECMQAQDFQFMRLRTLQMKWYLFYFLNVKTHISYLIHPFYPKKIVNVICKSLYNSKSWLNSRNLLTNYLRPAQGLGNLGLGLRPHYKEIFTFKEKEVLFHCERLKIL